VRTKPQKTSSDQESGHQGISRAASSVKEKVCVCEVWHYAVGKRKSLPMKIQKEVMDAA
jgi:hypothetical protein